MNGTTIPSTKRGWNRSATEEVAFADAAVSETAAQSLRLEVRLNGRCWVSAVADGERSRWSPTEVPTNTSLGRRAFIGPLLDSPPIEGSRALSSGVFATLLYHEDARRAAEVVEALRAHGLRSALTGGLAISVQLRAHGRPVELRRLNDIDFVVESFTSIPESLAGSFLEHHVHPNATDGKTLLQLVDGARRIRADVFVTLGSTLSRARKWGDHTGDLDVLSVEDLVARTTAFVCGRLRQGRTIDPKHATAFSCCADWADRNNSQPHGTTIASRFPEVSMTPHARLSGYSRLILNS